MSTDEKFDGVIVIAVSLDRLRPSSIAASPRWRKIPSRWRASTAPCSRASRRSPPARPSYLSQRLHALDPHRRDGLSHDRELDGIERIHTIVPVGKYPVYVSYGLSMAGLARMWLLDLVMFGLFAVSASIGLFSASLLALRRVRSEQGLVARWQDEVHRREQAEQVLRQTQKMDALGQLTGGVAHDFNNMLMVIGGNIEMLKRKAAGAGADRQIAAIEHAARNGEKLTRKLLAFSRRQLVKTTSIELEPFLPKVIDLVKPSLPPEVEIATDVPLTFGRCRRTPTISSFRWSTSCSTLAMR